MTRHGCACWCDPADSLPADAWRCSTCSSLADAEKHGYAILKEVEQRTAGKVRLSTGTLYGIIKRLLADGLIRESAREATDRRTGLSADGLWPQGRSGGSRTVAHARSCSARQETARRSRSLEL